MNRLVFLGELKGFEHFLAGNLQLQGKIVERVLLGLLELLYKIHLSLA